MSKYLTKVTETYRIDTEDEVDAFIKEQKAQNIGEVTKYNSTKKEVKSKGELLEEYFRVEVTKVFNFEREPDTNIEVDYITE